MTVVVGVTIFVALYTIANREAQYTFYKKLTVRRMHGPRHEIIESYRHMREHGNSLFIVLLELIFATAIDSVGMVVGSVATRLTLYGVTIILWILPGVLVWFIANQMERRFADDIL